MNTGDVMNWLLDRSDSIERKKAIEIHGDTIIQTITFKSGEVYEQTEVYRDSMHKETFVKIDGDLVFHGSWIYIDYEWRLTA